MTDELKEEVKETPVGDVQSEEKTDSIEDDTSKTIIGLQADKAILEEKLAQEILEKENYKKGMLSAKGKVKEEEKEELKEEVKEEVKEEKSEVTEAKTETTGYNPEKEAIAQFSKKYPNVNMTNVLAHYRGGKQDTVTGILDSLEDAQSYYEYKSGKTSDISSLANQGSGVSETKNVITPKVTTRDIQIADQFFKGDVARYLKYKKDES